MPEAVLPQRTPAVDVPVQHRHTVLIQANPPGVFAVAVGHGQVAGVVHRKRSIVDVQAVADHRKPELLDQLAVNVDQDRHAAQHPAGLVFLERYQPGVTGRSGELIQRRGNVPAAGNPSGKRRGHLGCASQDDSQRPAGAVRTQ